MNDLMGGLRALAGKWSRHAQNAADAVADDEAEEAYHVGRNEGFANAAGDLSDLLASHDEREGEAPRWWVILDEDGEILWGPLDDGAFMAMQVAEEAWAGATLHGLYIGPPVQPEEELDV